MRYLFLCLFVSCGLMCQAQQQGDVFIPFEDAYKRVYNIRKYDNVEIEVDGKLDENIWTAEEGWSEDFMVSMPVERLVPKSRTKAKIFYDDKFLYCGFYCKELEPEKMNRFIGNRDDNSIGDNVAIALDTYHDYRAAIEFNINLGGNKTDLVVLDNLELNLSWNTVWEARTDINIADSSWTAEFRIPFSQIRYNYQDTTGIWGVNLRRNVRHSNEIHKWTLIPRPNSGHVYSFGEIHGMVDLPKPGGIEFLPYTMGKFDAVPRIEGSPYQTGKDWNGNIGLDSKIALSDFTMDITINPDYGQVELDPSTMNLTAMETFYEEKRPFFLEGRHLLDFNNGSDKMFYTRRIGSSPSYHPRDIDNINNFTDVKENIPIIGALKLTGTNRKGVSLGVIESLTAKTWSKVTRSGIEDREVVEPLTNYSAIRLQKNWKGNTYVGGMITSVNRDLSEFYLRNNLIENAFTGGIDITQYFLDRLYYVDFKGMLSSLHGSKEAIKLLQERPAHYYQRQSADYLGVNPELTSLSGTGGHVEVGRKGTAKWNFIETFSWSSPGFDLNDMGYMRSTDFLSSHLSASYRQKGIWKNMRSNTVTFTYWNRWDYSGFALDNNASVSWSTTTLNRMQFNIQEIVGWNRVDNRMLRGGPDLRLGPYVQSYVSLSSDGGKRVVGAIDYDIDYNTEGHGGSHTITPSVTLRMGNHIYLTGEFAYTDNKSNLQYVFENIEYHTPAPLPQYVLGRIDQKTYGVTLKVQANITPDISLQFYGSPFTSTGAFTDFKSAQDTKSYTYENRFHAFTSEEITYSAANDKYSISRAGQKYSFKNPDFSFNEFRSNMVARWEYRPGSSLYFVWEHTMSDRSSYYMPKWGDNLDRMLGLPASNIFMVKLNYWFSV